MLYSKIGDSDIGFKTIYTSVIEYSKTLPNGIQFCCLGGGSYTGNDLPGKNYPYGCALILKRNPSAIAVVLFGATETTPLAINLSLSADTWTGWQIYALQK